MKIAVAQIDVVCGNLDKNFLKITEFIDHATNYGAEVVVFPELVDLGYDLTYYYRDQTKSWYLYQKELQQIALKYQVYIIIGGAEHTKDGVQNSQYLVSPLHAFTPIYSKNYLFIGESNTFSSGKEIASFEYDNVVIGLQICFDIRFPEHLRRYEVMPEVILVSAAWPLKRINHWEQLLIARAIENQCYIVASNRVGTDKDLTFGGTSIIVSPNGEIVSQSDRKTEKIICADLDIQNLRKLRESFPVLEQRKS